MKRKHICRATMKKLTFCDVKLQLRQVYIWLTVIRKFRRQASALNLKDSENRLPCCRLRMNVVQYDTECKAILLKKSILQPMSWEEAGKFS